MPYIDNRSALVDLYSVKNKISKADLIDQAFIGLISMVDA